MFSAKSLGQIIGWAWATANAHDTGFHPVIEAFQDRCVILSDTGFHVAKGDPPNLKICPRGHWNVRMLVETVHSMLTVVSHTQKMRHPMTDYFQSPLAMAVAAFNLLIAWNGLPAQDNGFVSLSIAEFSL
ncbi:MAG: hypothetical protein PHE55_08920 [Methylococcaceae bacterium]|nr:hypothetical protein [Methylococcaceae bacterium]